MDEFANQVGASIIVSYALEYLKNSNKFHLLNQDHSARYKAIIGAVAAFATTVGIHYTFDYDVQVGGSLVLALPSLTSALHDLMDFAKQWAFQQAAYNSVVKPTPPTAVVVPGTP